MKAEVVTKRFVRCPNGCEYDFAVEHLLARGSDAPRSAGPWYCDVCGQGWDLRYTSDEVDFRPYAGDAASGHDGKKRTGWVILELPAQTEPVRFRVRSTRFSPQIDEESQRYFYEEHTCPTNWLRDVVEVSIGKDADPHGLWKFVTAYDAEEGRDRS